MVFAAVLRTTYLGLRIDYLTQNYSKIRQKKTDLRQRIHVYLYFKINPTFFSTRITISYTNSNIYNNNKVHTNTHLVHTENTHKKKQEINPKKNRNTYISHRNFH